MSTSPNSPTEQTVNVQPTLVPSVPKSVNKVAHWDYEADVIVVGFGGAGASAAIEAGKAGAEVLVLERASAGGGSTAMAGGIIYFGGGTPVQKACGFEDSAEEMFKYLIAASGEYPDESKVRLYCEDSLEHFAWMVEQGIPFKNSFYPKKTTEPPTDDCLIYSGSEDAYPFNQRAKPAPRGHKPQIVGEAGGLIMKQLMAGALKYNTKVVENARVFTLVVDSDGCVVGVVGKIAGEEFAARARRGVILTAGGFIMNQEMLAKHAPKLMKCNFPIGCPGDDGTGIRMGMAVGGAAIHMSEGFVSLPFYPPSKLVKGILVNAQGQRFINEDVYHGRTGDFVLKQPDGKAYLILDNEIFGRPIAGMRLMAAEETIVELEAALNLPETTLQSTVAFFNKHAEQGRDPLFHKGSSSLKPLNTPPFAALECSVGQAILPGFTMGGLDTLVSGQVLTHDRTVVPGLFAAGRNSAGLPRCAAGYSSGMSIGGATFFGRQAGKSAALRTKS
jgi:3-oxo-5alpha-steroid 4-dehydrogenase